MAGSARLPTITGCTNSTATCCASVLAAPVPKTTSLPPWWKRTAMAWQAAATAPACAASCRAGSSRRRNASTARSPPWPAARVAHEAPSGCDRSTSASTCTGSLTLSAPKKPRYGLMPKSDWTTVPVAW